MADTALRVAKYGSIFFAFALFAIYTRAQAEKRTLTLESYPPTIGVLSNPVIDLEEEPPITTAPILTPHPPLTALQLASLAREKSDEDTPKTRAPILKKPLPVTTQQLQFLAKEKWTPWLNTLPSTFDPILETE